MCGYKDGEFAFARCSLLALIQTHEENVQVFGNLRFETHAKFYQK